MASYRRITMWIFPGSAAFMVFALNIFDIKRDSNPESWTLAAVSILLAIAFLSLCVRNTFRDKSWSTAALAIASFLWTIFDFLFFASFFLRASLSGMH